MHIVVYNGLLYYAKNGVLTYLKGAGLVVDLLPHCTIVSRARSLYKLLARETNCTKGMAQYYYYISLAGYYYMY